MFVQALDPPRNEQFTPALRWAAVCAFVIFLAGCTQKVTLVEGAVWSEDNETVFLAQYQGQVPLNLLNTLVGPIQDEMTLFLYIALMAVSPGRFGWYELQPDLSRPAEVMGWGVLTSDDSLLMEPYYWLHAYRKTVGMRLATVQYPDGGTMEWPVGCTVDVESKVRTDLVTLPAVLADLLGLELTSYIETQALEAIPSPDGSVIGVYCEWIDYASWEWVDFISFFDTASGEWLNTVNLTALALPNYPAPLRSPLQAQGDPYYEYYPGDEGPLDGPPLHFLWRKDSLGIYMLAVACTETECQTTPQTAWFVPVNTDSAAQAIGQVPARAVPTRGGRVSDTGLELVVVPAGEDGYEMELSLVPREGWIAFDDIPLVPLNQVDYLWGLSRKQDSSNSTDQTDPTDPRA